MITRQELLEYADTLYELKDSEVVKTYLKALHEVVTYSHSQKRKCCEVVRVITYCMDLEKALDKACEELSKTYQRTTCGEYKETCTLPFCAKDTCRYSRRLTKKEWKEWCKENVE